MRIALGARTFGAGALVAGAVVVRAIGARTSGVAVSTGRTAIRAGPVGGILRAGCIRCGRRPVGTGTARAGALAILARIGTVRPRIRALPLLLLLATLLAVLALLLLAGLGALAVGLRCRALGTIRTLGTIRAFRTLHARLARFGGLTGLRPFASGGRGALGTRLRPLARGGTATLGAAAFHAGAASLGAATAPRSAGSPGTARSTLLRPPLGHDETLRPRRGNRREDQPWQDRACQEEKAVTLHWHLVQFGRYRTSQTPKGSGFRGWGEPGPPRDPARSPGRRHGRPAAPRPLRLRGGASGL